MAALVVSSYHDPHTGEFTDAEGNVFPFYFFPKKRTFVTEEGTEIFFRIVNSQFMFSITEAYAAKYKPKMPQIAIEYEEGKYTLSGNEKDPAYIDAMNDYYQAIGLFALERQVSLSCRIQLPDEFDEVFLWKLDSVGIDPTNEQEMKQKLHTIRYLWVMHLLSSPEEEAVFLHIIAGQQLPTKSAIEEAEKRFPSQA